MPYKRVNAHLNKEFTRPLRRDPGRQADRSALILPFGFFQRRRACAVVFTAGVGKVVVMTKAVLQRRFADREVVSEVIVKRVP